MWIYFEEIRREIIKFVGILCVYSFLGFSNAYDVTRDSLIVCSQARLVAVGKIRHLPRV